MQEFQEINPLTIMPLSAAFVKIVTQHFSGIA